MLGSHVNGLQSMQPISSFQQECIPVGCVPAAHWPYSRVCFRGGGVSAPGGCLLRGAVCSRGGCLLRGCLLPGGVCLGGCLLPGWCLLWWGVYSGGSALGVSAPGECLLPGRCLLPGGCLLLGGVCSLGVSAPRGVSAWGGVCSQGVVSQHALRQTPPPLWTEWQTGAKILPWPQLRCGR